MKKISKELPEVVKFRKDKIAGFDCTTSDLGLNPVTTHQKKLLNQELIQFLQKQTIFMGKTLSKNRTGKNE